MGDDLDELLDDLGRIPGDEVDDPGAETSRAEELQEEWGTERGQLWQVGRHRLLCGDATDESDVERLLDGAEPRLMVTDPPYGVDYTGGTKEREALTGDRRGTSIYHDFLPVWNDYLDPKAPLYLWHADCASMPVMDALDSNGWQVRAQIIWAKNHAQFGALGAQYKQKHEPCFYCFRDTPYWHGPNNAVTVWEHDRAAKNEHHPTQKPPEVMARAISNSSQPEDALVDCFAGGGSTIIAAEQEGRTCYAMEIDPAYCAVILERCSEAGMECELIE
jgi:DNA modification methylase